MRLGAKKYFRKLVGIQVDALTEAEGLFPCDCSDFKGPTWTSMDPLAKVQRKELWLFAFQK